MRSKHAIRQEKVIMDESDDDPTFSAEDTDQDSDDDRHKKIKKIIDKRKRDSSDSDPDDPPEKEVKKKKKMSKSKSKYNRNADSESDPDDPPMENEDSSPKKDESDNKHPPLVKKSITAYTDEEMREKFKYKRHKCMLDYLPTKTNKPIGKCRRGRPAELKVDEVKLHYVVHYKEHGLWDHIVPEEGENEGKIDSYECKVCLKKFKNSLEKKIYQGRGSSICHVATEHGRLLKALLNEGPQLYEEIEFLAQHDKSFNDAYNEYFENKEALFGTTDEEIISIKPSLVWKIYAKNDENKSQNDASRNSSYNGKENYNANHRVQSAAPSGEVLVCPFKKELNCQFKDTPNCHSFRMHFFQHYPVDDYWLDRIKDLEQGEKCYYCDLCTQRKRIKGDTPQGMKKSMVCHLAIQHYELRPMMEKDSRLTEEFVKAVYFDIDEEKRREAESKNGDKPVTTTANNAKKEADNKTATKAVKSTTTDEVKKDSSIDKSTKSEVKKPVGKYKPGPKSKTRPKEVEKKKKQRKQKSDDSKEEDDDIPDLSSDLSSDEAARKSKNGQKSSNPKMPRQNENYVRKRKPLNLTLEDLEADEAEDENWNGGRSDTKANKSSGNGKKSRQTPKRKAAEKKATFSDESE